MGSHKERGIHYKVVALIPFSFSTDVHVLQCWSAGMNVCTDVWAYYYGNIVQVVAAKALVALSSTFSTPPHISGPSQDLIKSLVDIVLQGL